MKFSFDTYDEYQTLWESVHSAIKYWKKMKQQVEGKINLYVDPNEECPFDLQYVTDQMIQNALILKSIEDSPHPDWNDKTETYEIVEGVEYYSHIITQTLKLMAKG